MDGRAGLPASTVQDYQSSCSQQLVAFDAKAYEQGRLQGIAHFCTTERGFSYALEGGDYLQSCPATMQDDFLAGYNAGLRMYSVSQPLKEARSGADIATYAARVDLSTLVAASDPVYAGEEGTRSEFTQRSSCALQEANSSARAEMRADQGGPY